MKLKCRRIINVENDVPEDLDVDERALSEFLLKETLKKNPPPGKPFDLGHILLDFLGSQPRYTVSWEEKFEVAFHDLCGPDWFVIRKRNEPAFIFFYIRQDGSFLPVFPSKKISVQPHSGTLGCFDFNGEEIKITPYIRDLWPWILLGTEGMAKIIRKRKEALPILNELISDKSEVNPLTMLIRSAQPYRGLGLQIGKKLEEIKKILD